MDRKRPVLGGSVRFPQYLGWSWTGCGPRLPVFGAKNRTEPDLRTLVPVHVDDGLSVTNSIPLYNWFITELCKDIEVVDMGPVSLYLGIRITHDRPNRKLYLSQKAFVTDLLDTWNMTKCYPSSIPLCQKLHELPDPPPNSLPDVRDEDIKVNFQRLVSSLTYLAVWCMSPWH